MSLEFLTYVVLLFIVSAVLVVVWKKRVIRRCNLNEVNYPLIPFLGHVTMLSRDSQQRMETVEKLAKQAFEEGDIAFWIGNRLFAVTVDPINAEHVLKSHLHKDGTQEFFREITGNGTLFAEVPIWRKRRRLMASLFCPKNIELFVEIFAKQSETMVRQMRSAAGKPSQLFSYITKYTFDSVCNTTLGINIDAQNNPDHPFMVALLKAFKMCCNRMMIPFYYLDIIYKRSSHYREFKGYKKIIYDFIFKTLEQSVNTIKTQTNKEERQHKIPTITEHLMQANESTGLSLDEQCEEVLVLVTGGVDTSAIAISFTIHMLAQHQDVQEKVYQELMDVFGDSTRSVTSEDLPRLQYLEMVIKETLRLFPPIPLVARAIKQDAILPSGVILPKGSYASISIYAIHRNPRYWGADADQFRPERFLEPFKHPKQFMPFGDGPRICIGYKYAHSSMKTALATLLRRYKVLAAHFPDVKDYCLRIGIGIILKDKDHVNVRLELR